MYAIDDEYPMNYDGLMDAFRGICRDYDISLIDLAISAANLNSDRTPEYFYNALQKKACVSADDLHGMSLSLRAKVMDKLEARTGKLLHYDFPYFDSL